MNKTAISANNAFLANIELIERGKAKSATPKGSDLAQALEHELPEQIEERWARVVGENEFLEKMAAAVKIRGKMDSSTFESHIAYSAGEAKSPQVMTGARAVIDMLCAAGVVREDEGQLVASTSHIRSDEDVQISLDSRASPPTSNSVIQTTIPQAIARSTGASLHIELRIDAKPSELDGLGEKIHQLLLELNNPDQSGQDDRTSDS